MNKILSLSNFTLWIPVANTNLMELLCFCEFAGQVRVQRKHFANISDVVDGKWEPYDCKPTDTVAVLIPHRGRDDNLHILVHHLHMMLQLQKLQYGIYVIEQVSFISHSMLVEGLFALNILFSRVFQMTLIWTIGTYLDPPMNTNKRTLNSSLWLYDIKPVSLWFYILNSYLHGCIY